MPMYDYRCPKCNTEFEEMNKVADRKTCECACGATADQVIINNGLLDPKMGLDPDFPTAAAKFRQGGERRGRGRDMTRANRETNEDIQRDAYNVRQALGETNITVS